MRKKRILDIKNPIQISPLWNAVVREFLANRRLHPPLECVRILSGRPHWPEKDVRVSMMVSTHVRADFRGAFRGWTECSWVRRLFLGGNLEINPIYLWIHWGPHTRYFFSIFLYLMIDIFFSFQAIPIDSPVLRLRMIRMDDHILYFYIFLFILAFTLVAYFVHPLAASSVGLIGAAVLAR